MKCMDAFLAKVNAEIDAILEAEDQQLNMCMEPTKTPQTTVIPADFLATVEFLPNGTATTSRKILLESWAEFAQQQVAMGKIKLYDIPEFDPDTGGVPNEFILQVYRKNRTVN